MCRFKFSIAGIVSLVNAFTPWRSLVPLHLSTNVCIFDRIWSGSGVASNLLSPLSPFARNTKLKSFRHTELSSHFLHRVFVIHGVAWNRSSLTTTSFPSTDCIFLRSLQQSSMYTVLIYFARCFKSLSNTSICENLVPHR